MKIMWVSEKIRKSLAIFIAMFLVVAFYVVFFDVVRVEAVGTSYYISYSEGNDNNSGTSSSSPWKNITKINEMTFSAGDQILLKCGDVWTNQTISLKGTGTSGNPIILSSYGTGAKPRIAPGQNNVTCITGDGLSGWKITNIDLSNAKDGISLIYDHDYNNDYVYIQNVDFHDLNSNFNTYDSWDVSQDLKDKYMDNGNMAGGISVRTKTTFGESHRWNFVYDPEGWQYNASSGNNLTKEIWAITSTGADPYIISPFDLGADASRYKYFKVKMKNSSSNTNAKIYFITDSDLTWNEAKSKTFTTVANDAGYTEYVIDMSTVTGWTGKIAQVRLDIWDVHTGSYAYIDSIGISDYHSLKKWTYNTGNEGWSIANGITSSVSNGIFTWNITNSDPYIFSPDNINVDASKFKNVQWNVRNNTGAQRKAKLYFITTTDQTWNEAKSVQGWLKYNPSQYSLCNFDLREVPAWTGTIKQIRIDPVDDSTAIGASVDVDHIAFTGRMHFDQPTVLSNLTIDGCSFTNVDLPITTGVAVNTKSAKDAQLKFGDYYFGGFYNPLINYEMEDYGRISNLNITNCQINEGGYYAITLGFVDHGRVYNCSSYNTGFRPNRFGSCAMLAVYCTDLDFDACTIVNQQRHDQQSFDAVAFDFEGGNDDVTLTNCMISGVDGAGIFVYDNSENPNKNFLIQGNRITNYARNYNQHGDTSGEAILISQTQALKPHTGLISNNTIDNYTSTNTFFDPLPSNYPSVTFSGNTQNNYTSRLVSKNRVVYASSGTNSQYAVDENIDTYWLAGSESMPQYLTVDLGSVKTVYGFDCLFKDITTWHYRVYVSTDNVNWTEVVNRTSQGHSFYDWTADYTARYVKLHFDSADGGSWAGVKEFRVHGYN